MSYWILREILFLKLVYLVFLLSMLNSIKIARKGKIFVEDLICNNKYN